MRFLLVQYRPAVRLYKLAWALGERGHRVAIAHLANRTLPPEHAWMSARFPHLGVDGPADIDDLAAGVDAIVHFNANVRLALGGRESAGYTVFVGDLAGLRDDADKTGAIERDVLRSARGLLFVSDQQRTAAERTYGAFDVPSLAVHNGPIAPMLALEQRPKLSAGDGKLHVVYSGTIAHKEGVSRDIVPLFEALFDDPEITVHVVPSGLGVPDRLARYAGAGKLVLHDTVPSRELIGLLTQFDVGLVYVDALFPAVRDTMRPNKLYEYVAAGLPVVANRGAALESYLTERRAGVVFDGLDEVPDAARAARELAGATAWPPPVETWESQAPELERFFAEVRAAPPRHVASPPPATAEPRAMATRATTLARHVRRLAGSRRKARGSSTPGVAEWHEAWARGDRPRVLLLTQHDADGTFFDWADALNRYSPFAARLAAFKPAPNGRPNDLVLPAREALSLRAEAELALADAVLPARFATSALVTSTPRLDGDAIFVPRAVDTRRVPSSWQPGSTVALVTGARAGAQLLAAALERDLALDLIAPSQQSTATERVRQATLVCDAEPWYGRLAVEAAAAGVPVVAMLDGRLVEHLRRAGDPVADDLDPLHSEGALHDRALAFFAQTNGEQLAAAHATRAWIERTHDSTVVAARFERIYERTVA